ncbi:ganglioside GM2 activator-like [Babylonia areolata]|uniref:ganglioside GM2 activator-like n=1 Tax=Babylonia areolata TaxID=304850 RepID=UPI003FCF2782
MDDRQMIAFILMLCCLSPLCQSLRKQEKTLKFSDCGSDPQRPIMFGLVKARPIPVVVPGTLYVTLKGSMTSQLPRHLTIELHVMKYIFGFPFTVPCLRGRIGSCTYDDFCSSLERFEERPCPRRLQRYGVPCRCHVQAGNFSVQDLPLNVPKVQGYAASLLNGDYKLVISVYDIDHVELGCLELQFTVKKRHSGWLFKI